MTDNNTDKTVWVTKYASKYHTDPECMHLAKYDRNAREMRLKIAERSRRELCKKCAGLETNSGGKGGKSKLERILDRQRKEIKAD